ncbi:multicopper oxidase domain-containing protein [Candidatus Methylospira mobilis]|uniref:multicopper oxidase domain-containing protein n=1 Tax=Candidatus Methylospira mobilis TaxID=1808979 RepID=UPI0028EB9854|nr:multicopper oxidase domain-containing protein [Candidatus Methylospira mobilis]WNV06770.1 multicopper oxidase domain-containing protein [Candidatus Methylospira mobilis]
MPQIPHLRNIALILLALTAVVLLINANRSENAEQSATRTYYIAAEEVLWDYAPSYPINPMHKTEFGDDQKVFVEGNGKDRIGHRCYKAHFVEYSDASFSRVKPRPPEWEHLGILGPVIRANVGDTIKVVYRNNTKGMMTSVHPHGVFYLKNSEGTHYEDGTGAEDKKDDIIAPGAGYTYSWEVPERAGPGPSDPNSIVWLYHSHADETMDTNTGLVGPIIISSKGALDKNNTLKGVDREFIVLFTVFDENKSFYLDRNIQQFAPQARNAKDDEAFQESNLKHSMNGYIYDNLPGLKMKTGENIRWYQLALGTEVDLHTPHWHGNTLLSGGHRIDVVNLLPATHATLDMKADNPGIWMYHCHVNDHIEAGMMGHYEVESNH